MEVADYLPLVHAGAEGLVVYQETYHRPTYAKIHLSGPKKNYDWRLDCPERAYEAGFRRIGIGALYGLWHWREEAMALAAHLEHLSALVLEGPDHRQPPTAPARRWRLPPDASPAGPRLRPARLRFAHHVSSDRNRAQHA